MTSNAQEIQLVFPFIEELPPEPDVLAGEIGGQTDYVEAEQFILPLFPEMDYPTKEFYKHYE